jgi:hypothetical protein
MHFLRKMFTARLASSISLLLVILASILGGLIAGHASANGPWGYTDPVAYISTARSLDQGQGLGYYEADAEFDYFTIQPPFYPIALAGIGLFRVNLVVAARWLNLLAFVVSIFLAGWMFIRHTHQPLLGVAVSALFCIFPNMVEYFSSAYSEPLFILLFLAGGTCLLAFLRTQRRWLLGVSIVVFSFLPLTRYAGIAMLLAAGLVVFLFTPGKFARRLGRGTLFTVLAALPVVAWLAWVYLSSSHSIGGRVVQLAWNDLAATFQAFRGIFMDTFWNWVPYHNSTSLLRYRDRFLLLAAMLVVFLAVTFLATRRLRREGAGEPKEAGMSLLAFFGFSGLATLTFLAGTFLFTQPTIDIDNRMLLPFYVCLVPSLFAGFALWNSAWFRGRLRLLQILPWLAVIPVVLWYTPQALEKADHYNKGGGLTAYRWDGADIIQAVRALPSDQPVISNDWEVLLLWTGRPIHDLWSTFPQTPPIQVTPYGTDSRDPAQQIFCSKGATLVIFDDFPAQYRERVDASALPQAPNLFAGLTVQGTYSRSVIYLCP